MKKIAILIIMLFCFTDLHASEFYSKTKSTLSSSKSEKELTKKFYGWLSDVKYAECFDIFPIQGKNDKIVDELYGILTKAAKENLDMITVVKSKSNLITGQMFSETASISASIWCIEKNNEIFYNLRVYVAPPAKHNSEFWEFESLNVVKKSDLQRSVYSDCGIIFKELKRAFYVSINK